MAKKAPKYIALVDIGTDPVTHTGRTVKVGKTADAIDPDKLQAFIDAGLVLVEESGDSGDDRHSDS